jgi:hypothetical protein
MLPRSLPRNTLVLLIYLHHKLSVLIALWCERYSTNILYHRSSLAFVRFSFCSNCQTDQGFGCFPLTNQLRGNALKALSSTNFSLNFAVGTVSLTDFENWTKLLHYIIISTQCLIDNIKFNYPFRRLVNNNRVMKRNFPSVPSLGLSPSRLGENQFTDRMKFGMNFAGLGSEKQNTLKVKTSVPSMVTQLHNAQLRIMFRLW